MADILSQSEIDELLIALASGRDAPPVEKPEHSENDHLRAYNFRTANKFSKEQIRMLRFIHENYSGRLSTFLSGMLRAACDIEVVSIEEQTFSEFSNSLPLPAFLAIFDMPPLAGSAMMELSPTIAYEIISRLFGGTGQFQEYSKLFTEIEIATLTRVVQKMLTVMNESWVRVTTVNATLDRIETSAQFAQIVSASEPIVIVTFNVKIGDVSDLINLCIPRLAIQPISQQLAMKSWYSERANSHDGQVENIPEVNPRIIHTALTLRAVFDSTPATVQDVVSLQVGDVIRVDHPVSKPITVMVEHMPKFKAMIGQKEHRLALKITDILKEVPEDGIPSGG
ncbi:MAG: flagellar motor switch protein FliM [Bacillota bacterium]